MDIDGFAIDALPGTALVPDATRDAHSRRHGLRDLHVGLHRQAEGRAWCRTARS